MLATRGQLLVTRGLTVLGFKHMGRARHRLWEKLLLLHWLVVLNVVEG